MHWQHRVTLRFKLRRWRRLATRFRTAAALGDCADFAPLISRSVQDTNQKLQYYLRCRLRVCSKCDRYSGFRPRTSCTPEIAALGLAAPRFDQAARARATLRSAVIPVLMARKTSSGRRLQTTTELLAGKSSRGGNAARMTSRGVFPANSAGFSMRSACMPLKDSPRRTKS
jgi:hypothetical protein